LVKLRYQAVFADSASCCQYLRLLILMDVVNRLTAQKTFIGSSDEAIRLIRLIALCANSDAPILIQGETGAGKEVVSRELHRQSARSAKNFVGINCAAIPAQLLESELFGHKKGAFSGAIADRVGRFQLADQGTLFLDEIGDMPLDLQVKLLRVLEEREVMPVGASRAVPFDVRLIAATHQDLEGMVARKEFREDLYYRLNVVPIVIPPLRDRQTDIAELCHYYISLYSDDRKMSFTPKSIEVLSRYRWPGNVRELANLVKRLSVLSPEPDIELALIPAAYLPPQLAELLQRGEEQRDETSEPGLTPAFMAQLGQETTSKLSQPVSEVERIVRLSQSMDSLPKEGIATKNLLGDIESNLIRVALTQSEGNVSKAAKLLQIGRTTLIQKLEKYQIENAL
jgi:sigma-54 dependent transcriptional regulator, flagellar regulatory protein